MLGNARVVARLLILQEKGQGAGRLASSGLSLLTQGYTTCTLVSKDPGLHSITHDRPSRYEITAQKTGSGQGTSRKELGGLITQGEKHRDRFWGASQGGQGLTGGTTRKIKKFYLPMHSFFLLILKMYVLFV